MLHYSYWYDKEVEKNWKISPTGNWTPVSRVTGGDTHHYTIEEPICWYVNSTDHIHHVYRSPLNLDWMIFIVKKIILNHYHFTSWCNEQICSSNKLQQDVNLGIDRCYILESRYLMSHLQYSHFLHVGEGDCHKDVFWFVVHHRMMQSMFPSYSILPKLHGLNWKNHSFMRIDFDGTS